MGGGKSFCLALFGGGELMNCRWSFLPLILLRFIFKYPSAAAPEQGARPPVTACHSFCTSVFGPLASHLTPTSFCRKITLWGENPFQKIVQGLFSQRLSPSKGWFMLPCLEVVTFLMLSPPVSPLFVKRAWTIFRHGMKPRPTPFPLLANVMLYWSGLGWRWKIHTTAIVWILKVPQRPMH